MANLLERFNNAVGRRTFLVEASSLFVAFPQFALAQTSYVWSATDAHDALSDDLIRMIDVRSREEWKETGVASQAWPISLHEDRFPDRLFAARTLADGRPVAIICATGGRSGMVLRSLRRAGYDGFADVSEGMLGSGAGPGWIASGLPIVTSTEALRLLPTELA